MPSQLLFMAPMEGITDVPFRKIIRKHGCHVTCTQMIHAEGLLRGNGRRLRETITMEEAEKPVGLQLCGTDPTVVAEAARKAVDLGAAFVDLNMGCPAKNIVAIGAGAALLREPERAAQMVRETVRAVDVPVTVKIRAGWDDHYRNALELAPLLESEGASRIAVHARTRQQVHQGAVDWNLLRELKTKVSIPVVGNGGIDSAADIDRMFAETGVDGVMVARGALGNPWIFSRRLPSVSEIHATILEHLDLHLSFYVDAAPALLTFRKHLVWYTRGLRNATDFRSQLFQEKSLPAIVAKIHDYFESIEAEENIPCAG